MFSDRLRNLARDVRIQRHQHSTAQRVLADQLDYLASMAPCATVADRLRETAAGLRTLADMDPWEAMTPIELQQFADFLELAAGTAERSERRSAAGGAA
ncbi:hypothetical protein [Caenispirillum bisanense]|uniref:Uncharacterized protein n=1 Tax=Caenispirillum bisanense TaxID=414052 RepID=A0A286GYM0_9PROT|nr:hypothetical protein [Caenispirillum bisanense]SOE00617.1 hypothetical protein SAMN05421508_11365 [Caenispirillum bisanense]